MRRLTPFIRRVNSSLDLRASRRQGSALGGTVNAMVFSAILVTSAGLSGINEVLASQYSDKVLVVVNDDIITQSDLQHRAKTVLREMLAAGEQVPAGNFEKQILESMISDELQLQEAERRGIVVEDEELDQALKRFAAQQDMSLPELVLSLRQQGLDYDDFSDAVRDSITISRLTDYYAQSRVEVPDYEIDGFIAQNNLSQNETEYLIAHILIKGGEDNLDKAKAILSELNSGLSFQKAVLTHSEATNAQEGGLIGWRKLSQLPEVFSQAIKELSVDDVSDVLVTENGLHILKLLNVRGQVSEIEQSKVEHILITATNAIAIKHATKQIQNIRQRISDGEEFSALARALSDDSTSAAVGGDLGWVSQGMMVKPFEQAYISLPLGELSEPVVTQYGVHLLRVTERRKKNINDRILRNRAEDILRRQRAGREYQQWVRSLRDRAYINYVNELG